jgi:thiamine-phosphate pyrophosphorylase
MDARLVAWARAARRRDKASRPRPLPRLWLFTDTRRLPDPRQAVANLPRGLAGVVLRHDDAPNRWRLARDLAALCRRRQLAMVVAGDVRLAAAVGAGVHLRGGRWPGHVRLYRGWITSSAHDAVELRRARRSGADLVFLSPIFATASHPGAAALGAIRWTGLARSAGLPVAALGGIDGTALRRLPGRVCLAVGSISALT